MIGLAVFVISSFILGTVAVILNVSCIWCIISNEARSLAVLIVFPLFILSYYLIPVFGVINLQSLYQIEKGGTWLIVGILAYFLPSLLIVLMQRESIANFDLKSVEKYTVKRCLSFILCDNFINYKKLLPIIGLMFCILFFLFTPILALKYLLTASNYERYALLIVIASIIICVSSTIFTIKYYKRIKEKYGGN